MLLLALLACHTGTDTDTDGPTDSPEETGTEPCTPAPMDCDTCGEVQAIDSCGHTVTLSCGACPGTCDDGVWGDEETDVDCGGPDCDPCGLGADCATDDDCDGATCQGGTCVDGRWASVPRMPTARGDLAAVWFEGRLVAIGGYHQNLGDRRDVEAYDPTVNGWTSLADLPRPRYAHDAIAVNGTILVAGGAYDGPDCRTTLAYDPGADRWIQRGSLQQCRSWGRLAIDGDGVIRMIGGFDPTRGQLDSVERYDPVADAWTVETRRLAVGRSSHAVAVGADGAPVVFGGRSLADAALDSVERLSGGSWFTVSPMPVPRDDLAVAWSDGRFYVVGALDRNNSGLARRVDVTDGTTWSLGARMPTPRREADATTSDDGRIWVAGGWLEEQAFAEATAVVEVLTPTPALTR